MNRVNIVADNEVFMDLSVSIGRLEIGIAVSALRPAENYPGQYSLKLLNMKNYSVPRTFLST